MKLFIYTFALFFSTIYLNAQTDCNKLLVQKINLQEEDSKKMQLELVTNFSKLKDCGLDEVDIIFFGQPPVLSALVLSWINDDPEKVTYQRILDEILKMKATPEYNESIKFYNDFQLLRSKKIDLSNWDIDSKLLLQLVKDERAINSIYELIKNNDIRYATYGEMIDDFNKIADSFLANNERIDGEPNFYKDAKLIDYAEMLKRAKESGKPLLIYFTAYADVNSRKMEDAFLYDSDIQEYLESNYFTVTLFVDNKKEVAKEHVIQNSKTGKTMKTYGAFYSKLQEEHFKNQSQPYFAIVSIDGKILKTQAFTMKKKEFKKFLK